MKKTLALSMFLLMFSLVFAGSASASVRVGGYTTSRGTYVAPYYRSSPDRSTFNNYSTKGNYNPYTGSIGYTSPYKSYSTPSYRSYSSYSTPSYKSYSTPSYRSYSSYNSRY